MSTSSPAQPAKKREPNSLEKTPADHLTAAHSELNAAAGKLADLIKKLANETPNISEAKDQLKDVIKTTAEAGKILALTYPQFKS